MSLKKFVKTYRKTQVDFFWLKKGNIFFAGNSFSSATIKNIFHNLKKRNNQYSTEKALPKVTVWLADFLCLHGFMS